jgi:hypothetical protein
MGYQPKHDITVTVTVEDSYLDAIDAVISALDLVGTKVVVHPVPIEAEHWRAVSRSVQV